MNLVIDDAVEVKQVTKTNDKESRRPLGTTAPTIQQLKINTNGESRTNSAQGRQCIADSEPVCLSVA